CPCQWRRIIQPESFSASPFLKFFTFVSYSLQIIEKAPKRLFYYSLNFMMAIM
ncbi:MAG: hypothetical protein ACJAWI_002810, partial [Marinomonas primoryensis]